MKKIECELCCCEITSEEIANNLVFDFVHPCGKHGWYHIVCAMEIIDKGDHQINETKNKD